MDEPREAIFITEVLQDGRATNIMAMLTGSLVLATAVFSLLAGQAWVRSRSRAQTFTDGSAWVTAFEWRASGDLSIDGDGSLEFGLGAGSLIVPLTTPSNQLDLGITVSDLTIDLNRISLTMLGEKSKSLSLVFTASQLELWMGSESSGGRMLAWSSTPCRIQDTGLMELSLSDNGLQVMCGETLNLAYPGLPIGAVSELQIHAERGPAFEATLSIQ